MLKPSIADRSAGKSCMDSPLAGSRRKGRRAAIVCSATGGALRALLMGGVLLFAEDAAATSCSDAMTRLTASQRQLLGPQQQKDAVEGEFDAVYAQEQQLKAQAAQARCNKRGSDLAACAWIEPQLAKVTAARRSLQNRHNSLVSTVSKLEKQVKVSQAAYKRACGNGPPPPAAPTMTQQQYDQMRQQQMINTFIGIGVEIFMDSQRGSNPGTPSGGCPPGTHPRRDGQPGCDAN